MGDQDRVRRLFSVPVKAKPSFEGPLLMGIDPSITHTGWAVVEFDSDALLVHSCGVVVTSKEAKKRRILVASDDHRRVKDVLNGLEAPFKEYRPAVLCAESPAGSQSASAAKAAGLSWSAVISFAWARERALYEITQDGVKKAMCGRKNASKPDVAQAVEGVATFTRAARKALDKVSKGKREHIYDAVAVVWALRGEGPILTLRGEHGR